MINHVYRPLYRIAKVYCFWLVVLMILFTPVEYMAIRNAYGPSTSYFNQSVASAKPGPGGKEYIRVGDPFLVHAEVIRHRINGTCQLAVWRVRQNIGGRYDGRISLIQYIDQNFVGDGTFRHTSWPISPTRITVENSWFDDPNAHEQTIDVFVIARYYCNFLDSFFPRWLDNYEGDEGNKSDAARVLNGFSIPHWDPAKHLEGPHSRVVMVR